ncbi:MAG: hypothetical protein RR238_10575 [Lachnospiraceae bacterium]
MRQHNKHMLIMMLVTFTIVGCGKKQDAMITESVVAESTVAKTEAVTTEETTESVTPIEEKNTKKIDGIILDAAMNSLEIQSTDGIDLEFSTAEGVDTTGLKEGILIGNAITVTYIGTVDGNNTSTTTVLKLSDSEIKPALDREQLQFAADVMLAVQLKNVPMLSEYVTYPVYVGLKDGMTIDTKEEFQKLDADTLFTPELIEAVSHVNLFEIEEVKAGVVLGDGSPNITFDGKEDEYGITGINY